jgi:hypothetical protein
LAADLSTLGGMKLPWSVTAPARNIHIVDLVAKSATDHWWFLLSGDRHHDNPHADHELEKKHLDEVVKRKAGWIDVGDLFCAMEGRADPRRSRKGVREEHAMAPDYFDSIVNAAAEFYKPYAQHCVVIGRGNHEASVLKNNETDLTERLCERMSMMSKCKVYPGGYGGWIKFRTDRGGHRYALNLKYFHGSGGAALMSFDTLKVRRQAAVMPDADVIVQGHVHKQWVMPLARERLISDKAGMRIRHDVQYHVRVGTYKDEFQDGYGGFHVEQGRTPEIIGAVWMKLSLHHEIVNGETRYSLRPEFFPIH